MATDLIVANRALAILGEPPITAFTDASKAARTIAGNYETIRDAFLRAYRWKFAMKRAALSADTESPVFGFQFAYSLPADCLRLDFINESWVWFSTGSEWRDFSEGAYAIDGRKIVTNQGAPLQIRYVSQADASLFDATFVEALAARVAVSLAVAITQSESKKEAAMADLRMVLREAVTTNAIESPPQQLPDNEWMMSRLA